MVSMILSVTQVIVAILFIILVLLQQKGAGLGATFGGGSNIYTTKRGVDNILFKATIVFSILFFGVAIANILV